MEYRFNHYRLNPKQKLLYRNDELIEAEPRVLVLLHLLLRRYPETVTRRELLEALWPRQEVSDWSLSQLIRRTRQLLDDDSRNPTYIKTIHGIGLRFLVDPVLTETPAPQTQPVGISSGYKNKKQWLWGLLLLPVLVFVLYGWQQRNPVPANDNPLVDIEGYPYTIALLPIENNSINPVYSWVNLGLMEMLNQLLGESAGIMTLDSSSLLSFLESNPLPGPLSNPDNLQQAFDSICPALGCQILLAARLDEIADGTRLSYQLATAKGLHPRRIVTANTVLKAGSLLAQEITRWVDPARPWIVDVEISYSADKAANRAFAMGQQELLNGDAKTASQYLRIALEKDSGFLWAQVRLADARYRLNEHETAQQLITKILKQENLPPDIYYQALRVQSNLFYSQGKLEDSRAISEQLLKLAQASGDLLAQGKQLMHIGTSYQAIGENTKALELLLSAESIYRQAGYKPGIGNVLFNIGNVHTGATDYEKATPYYQQAELIFQQLGNRQFLAMSRFQQANLLKVTGKLDEAEKILKKLPPVFEKLGDTEGALLAQIDMAHIDILQGHLDSGIKQLQALLPDLQASKLEYEEYQTHNYLADAYLRMHRPQLAKEHIRQEYEYETVDPAITLLPARLALEEQHYDQALLLAEQARKKAGDSWKPEHQALLEKIQQKIPQP